MLNRSTLQEFTRKYQTTLDNVSREYCHHLFLSSLYRLPQADRLLFKGGSALRIIYKSPRFSEDLDFSGFRITQVEIENLFTDVLADLERLGIEVKIEEVKPTTGGYLGIACFSSLDFKVKAKIEVSLRPKSYTQGRVALISNDYIPAYNIIHLPQEKIAQGKLRALLNRSKPRDFYDIYFLLRTNLLPISARRPLSKVLDKLESQEINFQKELSRLLPKSHQIILKDFKSTLIQELKRFI